MLKGFNDGCGNVWRCFPKQLYLVEVTYELPKQVILNLLTYSKKLVNTYLESSKQTQGTKHELKFKELFGNLHMIKLTVGCPLIMS